MRISEFLKCTLKITGKKIEIKLTNRAHNPKWRILCSIVPANILRDDELLTGLETLHLKPLLQSYSLRRVGFPIRTRRKTTMWVFKFNKTDELERAHRSKSYLLI